MLRRPFSRDVNRTHYQLNGESLRHQRPHRDISQRVEVLRGPLIGGLSQDGEGFGEGSRSCEGKAAAAPPTLCQ